MANNRYNILKPDRGVPVKAWTEGVPLDPKAEKQLMNVARMPFIHSHIAVMPDVHWGLGATIGSVIPTLKAVIPAAVGVDIGCGMMAVQTSLKADDLPDNLKEIRSNIEKAVPHGRTNNGGRGDRGAWENIPEDQIKVWERLAPGLDSIIEKNPKVMTKYSNTINHLGTLGTGNHFIEVCLDEEDYIWFMLHSGSRGIGNRIGTFFIELAKQDVRKQHVNLPDINLAYFSEATDHFTDYVEAVEWAQTFAKANRELMMQAVIQAVCDSRGVPPFEANLQAVNCHHNYVTREHHFGESVLVTRKGAVRARLGDMGIIPGSMGSKSYIVRGLGNKDSFDSCSHGAGRKMSRTEAKRRFSVDDHIRATQGVECRKDKEVVDETPAAYKDIDSVMKAQKDLVEVVHTLRQIICVKG